MPAALRRLSRLTPHAALLPMALTVLFAYVGAALWTLRTSFTASRTFPSEKWIGLAQYVRLFDNERWLLSLNNLAVYGLLFVLASMLIGFLLAVFIDQHVRGEGLLRTVFLYPYAMSFIATGLVWHGCSRPARASRARSGSSASPASAWSGSSTRTWRSTPSSSPRSGKPRAW